VEDRVLKEAEKICEMMFPDNEVAQCLLHHHLACFAEYVEVLAVQRFRDELCRDEWYKPDEVKHG